MVRRVHWAAAIMPALAALAVGCAGGFPQPNGRRDGTTRDLGADGAGPDAYIWPDQRPRYDSPAAPDLPAPPDHGADTLRPDTGSPDSAPLACPDVYEPNQSCSAYKDLGSISESSSWSSRNATSNPGTDVDWYRAEGKESSHTCMPLTSQTYYFKVRLTVPAGRELRLCLVKGSCGGSSVCADNLGKPGPAQLNVQYKVSGTCALTDDTTAYFKVESVDGKGGCDPYTVAFNYD